jgi:WD40 repeat protein
VFTATTDRTLRVIDVSTGGDYWSVPNAAGSRKCHALALPSVAASSALPPETYNLIAAASVDGGGLVSLWDIRAASPAALFKGHVNRIANCNVAFSPCMRYISVGSEDAQGAATYDLRMGGGKGACCRTKENRGVKDGAVVDVQYNPIFPQLATASLGGIVKFYSEAKEKDVVGGNGRGGGGERELPMDTGMDRELGMEQTGFD